MTKINDLINKNECIIAEQQIRIAELNDDITRNDIKLSVGESSKVAGLALIALIVLLTASILNIQPVSFAVILVVYIIICVYGLVFAKNDSALRETNKNNRDSIVTCEDKIDMLTNINDTIKESLSRNQDYIFQIIRNGSTDITMVGSIPPAKVLASFEYIDEYGRRMSNPKGYISTTNGGDTTEMLIEHFEENGYEIEENVRSIVIEC